MVYFELKRTILKSGLKQGFIAKQVGLDPTLFSKKVNGYRSMTQKERDKLAKILDKKTDELFPGQSEA